MASMHFLSNTSPYIMAETARLNHPDRLKHIGFFVRGAMMDNAIKMGQNPMEEHYEIYIIETIEKVFRYLNGTQTLDGSCSDLQCHVAIEAMKAFD